MKLILITFLFSSFTTFAASKVVEKLRVTEEKIISAQGCSVSGDYTNSIYDAGEYKYVITMKIKVEQTQEAYKVEVKKNLFGKATETVVPNSAKPAPKKIIDSTQSISRIVRAQSEMHKEELIKGCEAEMLFINTGAYPPPPPKPPEPPKKETKPTTPVVTPEIPVLPDPIIPPSPEVNEPIPGIPSSNDPLFPVDIPGGPADSKKDTKKDDKK